jgi:hypothetical protein
MTETIVVGDVVIARFPTQNPQGSDFGLDSSNYPRKLRCIWT